MGKIKKVAISIGSFLAYSEKQFHRFLWATIIFFVALVCYLFANEGAGLQTFLQYVLIAAILFLAYALISFIVSLCLTPYHRKLERTIEETDGNKKEFATNYVSRGYINRPVYEALKEIFSYKANHGGKNVSGIFHVAQGIGWITLEPSCADVKKYFGEDIVGSDSNYSEQKNRFTKKAMDSDEFKSISSTLTSTLDKLEKTQKAEEKHQSLKGLLIQYLSK